MFDTFRRVIINVLQALYQPFLFALILSVFVLFFVLYLEKYNNDSFKKKIKNAVRDLKNKFVLSAKYRRLFYFVFCFVMVLFKTLLNRKMWENPVSNVMGVWGFADKDGVFTTEIIENVLLFIPLIFFLFFFLETTSKKNTKFLKVMGMAIVISFLSSLTIEMLQLFLRLGTWQLSDLAFNTLGGIIGGFIYWVSAKIRKV